MSSKAFRGKRLISNTLRESQVGCDAETMKTLLSKQSGRMRANVDLSRGERGDQVCDIAYASAGCDLAHL
jgi:hypothetical protein